MLQATCVRVTEDLPVHAHTQLREIPPTSIWNGAWVMYIGGTKVLGRGEVSLMKQELFAGWNDASKNCKYNLK